MSTTIPRDGSLSTATSSVLPRTLLSSVVFWALVSKSWPWPLPPFVSRTFLRTDMYLLYLCHTYMFFFHSVNSVCTYWCVKPFVPWRVCVIRSVLVCLCRVGNFFIERHSGSTVCITVKGIFIDTS